jgi:hypothetical protein
MEAVGDGGGVKEATVADPAGGMRPDDRAIHQRICRGAPSRGGAARWRQESAAVVGARGVRHRRRGRGSAGGSAYHRRCVGVWEVVASPAAAAPTGGCCSSAVARTGRPAGYVGFPTLSFTLRVDSGWTARLEIDKALRVTHQRV